MYDLSDENLRQHLQDGDMDFILNALLSDCAWGRLEPGPVWMPVGRLATDRCLSSLLL